MPTYEHMQSSPEQRAEALLARVEGALETSRHILTPEGADAPYVFPEPTQVRAAAPDIELSPDNEKALRDAAAELGIGRETSLTLSEQGLIGADVLIEGGQPHKIAAEAKLVMDDEAAHPAALFFTGTPYRTISGDAEQLSAKKQGVHSDSTYSEYDVAERIARKLDGFIASENVILEGFSYDIQAAEGQETVSGAYEVIGYLNSGIVPVVMLRIDREHYVDAEGNQKYRTLGPAGHLEVVAALREAQGDATNPVALVSSATYQPSREVDAAIAGLQTGRTIGVATYGTQLLADVKGTGVAAPAPLNQIPGELGKTEREANRLREILKAE